MGPPRIEEPRRRDKQLTYHWTHSSGYYRHVISGCQWWNIIRDYCGRPTYVEGLTFTVVLFHFNIQTLIYQIAGRRTSKKSQT